MMIGRWLGRALATVLALVLLAILTPALHVSCETGVQCSEWKQGAFAYLALYSAILFTPVVFIFLGAGSRRWLAGLGWLMLAAMTLFLLK
jgi:hypothetical protein